MIRKNLNKVIPSWATIGKVFLYLILSWGVFGVLHFTTESNFDFQLDLPKQYMAPLKELEGGESFGNEFVER